MDQRDKSARQRFRQIAQLQDLLLSAELVAFNQQSPTADDQSRAESELLRCDFDVRQALSAANRDKNRYGNILPYAWNLVRELGAANDAQDARYINASWANVR